MFNFSGENYQFLCVCAYVYGKVLNMSSSNVNFQFWRDTGASNRVGAITGLNGASKDVRIGMKVKITLGFRCSKVQ